MIHDVMHTYIPQKQVHSFVNHPEWWNEECEKALKKKSRMWRRWQALKTHVSRLKYNKARNEYTSISRKAVHKLRVKEKMTTELQTWHPGLLVKLAALGFSGPLLAWLKNYLTNRSLKVVLNGKESSVKPTNAGYPKDQ
jgi:hypothetical protein